MQWELGVLVYDLGIAHTLSQHNLSALLNGSKHTYAWRVDEKGTKPYSSSIIIRLFKNGRISFPVISPTCPVADTGFEKGGGALTQNFQINGFWPEFYIKKN